MKKIIFGITSLTLGGAERVLVDLCNVLAKTYDITIFCLYGEGEFEKELNPAVKVIHLFNTSFLKTPKKKRWLTSFRLQIPSLRNKLYKRYIEGYDVEIAFLEGPITWLFSTPSKARKIVWVHNDITSVFGHNLKTKAKKRSNQKAYASYDEIVFVSQDNLRKFNEYMKLPNKKQVIYNYIEKENVEKKALEYSVTLKNDVPNFVIVSRLTEQKAIERLLLVHKRLITDGYRHYIYVVGTGHLEETLKAQIKAFHVSDTFFLVGGKSNPYPYMKAGNYFGLLSYYEGYPMVLLEARILNAHIIITDTAAREVLEGYHNKKIVDNSEEGIYEGMKDVMEHDPFTSETQDFDNHDIMEKIKNVIEGSL